MPHWLYPVHVVKFLFFLSEVFGETKICKYVALGSDCVKENVKVVISKVKLAYYVEFVDKMCKCCIVAVVKQRIQMYNSPYKSLVDCIARVYQAEGVSAFYRSYTTQLAMNLPFQVTTLSICSH